MKYILEAYLPDGELLTIRTAVNREEAEEMVAVLCRVTKELYGQEPKREGDIWYVQSDEWKHDERILCWLERVEGQMLRHFMRYETAPQPVGKSVIYELRRDPAVIVSAYRDGIAMGHNSLPPDVWDLVLKTQGFLANKFGLTPEEEAELSALWQDFEGVTNQGDTPG